jgi:hypothetical protein
MIDGRGVGVKKKNRSGRKGDVGTAFTLSSPGACDRRFVVQSQAPGDDKVSWSVERESIAEGKHHS